MALRFGLLNSSISTCTFATDGTGDITVGASHGLAANDEVRFSTTGGLPPELDVNPRYFVLSAGLTTTKLRVATTVGGSAILFSTAGTGTHSIWKSTLFGDIEPRASGFIQPGRSTQAPTGTWSTPAGSLDATLGGCDFLGPTITVSAPHGLSAGQTVRFTNVLNTPLSAASIYYVLSSGLSTRQFQVSTTLNGTAIDFGSGYPLNDVWLYVVPATILFDYGNNVILHEVKVSVWKSTANLVLHGGDLGWYGPGYVFSWVLNLALTATESLSASVTAQTNFIYGSASETLVIASSAQVAPRVDATESLSTADAAVRSADLKRKFHEESEGDPFFSISDAATAIIPKMRTVSESLALFLDAAQNIGPRFTATESLSISDTAQGGRELVRAQYAGLLNIDSTLAEVAGSGQFVRMALDFLDAAVPLAIVTGVFPRGALESLLIGDVARLPWIVSASEALSIALSASVARLSSPSVSEALSLALSADVAFGTSFYAEELLVISDLAQWVRVYGVTATESLAIADFAHRSWFTSATESLAIAQALFRTGNYHKSASETLVASVLSGRHVTLLRRTGEALHILESAVGPASFHLSAAEALLIEQFAEWITGPHDPWEYWLDLRTGNLPTESDISTGEAESSVSVPEAESNLDAPEAESELVGSNAESGLRYIDP